MKVPDYNDLSWVGLDSHVGFIDMSHVPFMDEAAELPVRGPQPGTAFNDIGNLIMIAKRECLNDLVYRGWTLLWQGRLVVDT